jgi:hypothetical protein
MEFYVFGSLTSGEVDAGSDTDVLVVLSTGDEAAEFPISWSVYSLERLKSLFQRGTLFAWHLHYDAVKVWPKTGQGLLHSIGSPAPYTDAHAEIDALISMARAASDELSDGTVSPVFELGLLYTASRDVAMAAAPHLLGRFTFSRFAPLFYTDPAFPLSRAEYEFLMQCRRATTRGISVPCDVSPADAVLRKLPLLLNWFNHVLRSVPDGRISEQNPT